MRERRNSNGRVTGNRQGKRNARGLLRLAGVTNPMAEKFHFLGYAATFLYVPAATPETPYLLP